jgi:hypothetical protein
LAQVTIGTDELKSKSAMLLPAGEERYYGTIDHFIASYE